LICNQLAKVKIYSTLSFQIYHISVGTHEFSVNVEQTDQLIDEIVYELYGLSDEGIEIVEEAFGE